MLRTSQPLDCCAPNSKHGSICDKRMACFSKSSELEAPSSSAEHFRIQRRGARAYARRWGGTRERSSTTGAAAEGPHCGSFCLPFLFWLWWRLIYCHMLRAVSHPAHAFHSTIHIISYLFHLSWLPLVVILLFSSLWKLQFEFWHVCLFYKIFSIFIWLFMLWFYLAKSIQFNCADPRKIYRRSTVVVLSYISSWRRV